MCNGTNKRGGPCGTQYGLDGDGFCYWHRPNAKQCRGIAKWSKARCRIVKGLNANGYCKYHENQAPDVNEPVGPEYEPYVDRCHGIAASTGQRCRKDWEVYSNGYCRYHQGQVPIARLVLKPIKTQERHEDTQRAGAVWAARLKQRKHRHRRALTE